MLSTLNINQQKKAFTLAEVLTTLMVIGVVAALTIPSMMQNFREMSLGKQRTVFTKKFTEGLRQMRIEDKLNTQYSSTEDFVTEMKKYFKITQVCDSENLPACFSKTFTAKAYMENEETDSKTFITENIRTTRSLREKSGYDSDVIGLKFADGTSMLITYNTGCIGIEAGNTTGNHIACFGYIADINGEKTPNLTEKDIVTNMRLVNINGLNFEISEQSPFTKETYYNSSSENVTALRIQAYCKSLDEDGGGWDIISIDEAVAITDAIYSNADCTIDTDAYGTKSYTNCNQDKVLSNPLYITIAGDSTSSVYIALNEPYGGGYLRRRLTPTFAATQNGPPANYGSITKGICTK